MASPLTPDPIPTSGTKLDAAKLEARAFEILDAVLVKLGGVLRPGQQQMVRDVSAAVARRETLAGLGPTGVGKSVGYSVVLVAAAELAGWRSVIATESLALQAQLMGDMAIVTQAAAETRKGPNAGQPISFALLSGKANHVCHLKLRASIAEVVGVGDEEVKSLVLPRGNVDWARLAPTPVKRTKKRVEENDGSDDEDAPPPHTKEQAESVVRWAVDAVVGGWRPPASKVLNPPEGVDKKSTAWKLVTATSDECTGKECPFFDSCHARTAGAEARESKLVITNHTLVAMGAPSVGSAGNPAKKLPEVPVDVWLIDEGHSFAAQHRNRLTREWNPSSSARRIRGVAESKALAHFVDRKQGKAVADSCEQATLRLAEAVMAAAGSPETFDRFIPFKVEASIRLDSHGPRKIAAPGPQFAIEFERLSADICQLADAMLPKAVKFATEFKVAKTAAQREEALAKTLKSVRAAVAKLTREADRFKALAAWCRGDALSLAPTQAPPSDTPELDEGDQAEIGSAWNVVEVLAVEKGEVTWTRAPFAVFHILADFWRQRSSVIVSATLHHHALIELGLVNLSEVPFRHGKSWSDFALVRSLGPKVSARRVEWQSPFAAARERCVAFVPSEEASDAFIRRWKAKNPDAKLKADELDWEFRKAVAKDLIEASTGRVLALSPATKRMAELNDLLGPEARDQFSPGAIAAFKNESPGYPRVLVGTKSLFTGLSVSGMSLVVIDKAPRAAPNPLDDARSQLLVQLDPDNATRESAYVLDALTQLEQGIGRLIRREDDWGMVAVLDRRLHSGKGAYPEYLKLLGQMGGKGPSGVISERGAALRWLAARAEGDALAA